jgi:Methyltransferase domain
MSAQLTRLRRRLVWLGGAARLALEDPVEGFDRALLRLLPARRRTPDLGEPDQDWEERLHALIGAEWPCPASAEAAAIFSASVALLQKGRLAVGRGAYGGWDDADPAFARAVWCLTLHRAPRKVVETGVARGVTTRFILEALERNRNGHLWSIDRPPLDRRLQSQIGAAVPGQLRDRWTLIRGTSRRMLPGLLRRIAPIDLFVHDSLHTERNLRFELTRAWQAIEHQGAVVADDVERNGAFTDYAQGAPELVSLVAPADDGRSRFGILLPAGGVKTTSA